MEQDGVDINRLVLEGCCLTLDVINRLADLVNFCRVDFIADQKLIDCLLYLGFTNRALEVSEDPRRGPNVVDKIDSKTREERIRKSCEERGICARHNVAELMTVGRNRIA